MTLVADASVPLSDQVDSAVDRAAEEDVQANPYQTISRMAIVSLVLSVLSLLAFTAPALAILSVVGIVLGIIALSNIRRYPSELMGKIPAICGMVLSVSTLMGSTALHTYIYLTEVPEGYIRITFSDFRPSRSEGEDAISQRVHELKGKKIFIKGYVYPSQKGKGLNQFLLVRDKGTCCFGGQPKPYDMVLVKLDGDKRIHYSWRLRKLGGILDVEKRPVKIGEISTGQLRLQADYVK